MVQPVESVGAVQPSSPVTTDTARDAKAMDRSSATITGEQRAPSGLGNDQANASEGVIREKIDKVNQVLEATNQNLRYRMVDRDGRQIVQLFDQAGQKVIFQMPPEGILEISNNLQQMVGLMIDHKR